MAHRNYVKHRTSTRDEISHSGLSRRRGERVWSKKKKKKKKKTRQTFRRVVLRGAAIGAARALALGHLDVINQCDWIAGVRLELQRRRKGPFWGWTDPNRLWQGGYWKQVPALRSAGEAVL